MLLRKLGFCWVADGTPAWAHSHDVKPTPTLTEDGLIRVYVTVRDPRGVSRLTFVDLDQADPTRVIGTAQEPCFEMGQAGTFDSHGIAPMCLVPWDTGPRLYYQGRQKGVDRPFFLFAGLAKGQNGGTQFQRMSHAPILERANEGLFSRGGCSVMFADGRVRMWYTASSSWVTVNGKQVLANSIHTMESPDGIIWGRRGRLCLAPRDEQTVGFSRPSVTAVDSGWLMTYSILAPSGNYRPGYATSRDGWSWQRRDDELRIEEAKGGQGDWDNRTMCFGAILALPQRTLFFYNGNGMGATGFGVAELER